MEEEKKIKQISYEQDEAEEEETNKKPENEREDGNKAKEEAEVGEKGIDIDSSKKPKQSLKPNPKAKVTVPKPFSLATDQRKMARERRASVDGKANNAPTFTRSSSLINPKALHQVSNGGERNPVLRRGGSVRAISQASTPRKVTSKEPTGTKVENGNKAKSAAQGGETEKKKLQLDSKLGGEAETKKRTKSNTFKALSLPSFYKKKDSLPTTEAKKIQAKEGKPAVLDKECKSVTRTGDKGRVSRSVASTAKETISKLLKTTLKINHTKPQEIVKIAVVSNA